ncbi:hypothetical protein C5167_040233 [Papaver somniferum]|uniref:Uncharacterized protein n=1 Tax=Papaver somniferum TaxID=3469 RepID=A0A4Y7IGV3_PAPSO|nr:hypothetical protein C5167_040233 [Papaver somniferum]
MQNFNNQIHQTKKETTTILSPQDTSLDQTTTAAATRLLSGSTISKQSLLFIIKTSTAPLFPYTTNIATLSAFRTLNCTLVGL